MNETSPSTDLGKIDDYDIFTATYNVPVLYCMTQTYLLSTNKQ